MIFPSGYFIIIVITVTRWSGPIQTRWKSVVFLYEVMWRKRRWWWLWNGPTYYFSKGKQCCIFKLGLVRLYFKSQWWMITYIYSIRSIKQIWHTGEFSSEYDKKSNCLVFLYGSLSDMECSIHPIQRVFVSLFYFLQTLMTCIVHMMTNNWLGIYSQWW